MRNTGIGLTRRIFMNAIRNHRTEPNWKHCFPDQDAAPRRSKDDDGEEHVPPLSSQAPFINWSSTGLKIGSNPLEGGSERPLGTTVNLLPGWPTDRLRPFPGRRCQPCLNRASTSSFFSARLIVSVGSQISSKSSLRDPSSRQSSFHDPSRTATSGHSSSSAPARYEDRAQKSSRPRERSSCPRSVLPTSSPSS